MITGSDLQAAWWSPRPPALSRLLQPVAAAYSGLAALHRWKGQRMARAQARPAVPVVVVGNWVVGGAGKTPTVLALARHLQNQGWTPGLISRGYGRADDRVQVVDPGAAQAQDVGDEPLLLARRSGCPTVVGRQRVAARTALLHRWPQVDVVIADDGLQHRQLWRDLDLVVVDERGAGNGLCLPAGPLRQPIPRVLPSATLVVYSAGVATLPLPGYLAQRQLVGVQPWADWAVGRPLPSDGGWTNLPAQGLWAVAGIAAPQRFFGLLQAQGLRFQPLPMPDHHPYAQAPWPASTTDVVVTEKDAVKLSRHATGPTRVWVARLDLTLPDALCEAIGSVLNPLRPRGHGQPPA